MGQRAESCERIVVKYGGASLADHERITRAIEAVAKEFRKGTQVVVVVSAMGSTTDTLLSLANDSSHGAIEKMQLDDILSMGERTSVRLFAAALGVMGLETRYFDPSDEEWPIITDDNFLDANPILEICCDRIQRHILPLIEKGVVPVIAGFVGKTIHGKISTLGRGGSDTTAFILARALKATAAILVTDSDGIMSFDPKIVGNARRLAEIDVSLLVQLADSGTKFVHRKALRYKDSSTNVRMVDYKYGDLSREGTVIRGTLSVESDIAVNGPLQAASIAVVGRDLADEPTVIQELTERAKAYSTLLGLSANHTSIVLYVLENGSLDSLLNGIHEVILNRKQILAMTATRNLAFIETTGITQEEIPDVIDEILEALRLNKMNMFSISTVASSIILFVSWSEGEEVLDLIKKSTRRRLP